MLAESLIEIFTAVLVRCEGEAQAIALEASRLNRDNL